MANRFKVRMINQVLIYYIFIKNKIESMNLIASYKLNLQYFSLKKIKLN